MEMEINDSSDESINGSGKNKILSTSSDEDFVNARNECELLGNEVNEYTTEEEYSESDSEEEVHDKEWQQIRERNPVINEYSEEEEFLIENADCNDPFSLYKLFFTDYILDMIVEETNKYAVQCINNSSSSSKRHQQAWQPVTRGEMNTFIGILLIMGVTQLPEIRLYWSKKDMYTNARIKNAMKRDRFLYILKFLHFSDNTTARTKDRLNKLRNIVEAIVDTFKNTVKPGKNIVINESMVPWRGCLGFRQYIPGKRHKYGIKLYKLCFPEGYTYNIDIYARINTKTIEKTHSHDVVMRLISGLLFKGRILFTDSYYTSVPLAEELLQKRTFICGTVKLNKKCLPPQAKRKQKRGNIMIFENRSGVKFLKWTDKRPVCMLTTSKNHMCTIIRNNYNTAKKGVDLSDQMTSHYSCLLKTVKWYRKIIIQLICGTCLVNAWYIHRRWGNKHINTLQFREKIIDHFLTNNHHIEEMAIEKQIRSEKGSHFLHSYEGSARKSRKRCKECYKCLYEKEGRDYAMKKTKRVTTYCNRCEGQPALCLKCFQKLHRNT